MKKKKLTPGQVVAVIVLMIFTDMLLAFFKLIGFVGRIICGVAVYCIGMALLLNDKVKKCNDILAGELRETQKK